MGEAAWALEVAAWLGWYRRHLYMRLTSPQGDGISLQTASRATPGETMPDSRGSGGLNIYIRI
jgi:hypothetical protein